MALVGAAKLVARMGVARMGTTRMGVLSLVTVGSYVTTRSTSPAVTSRWKRVAPPTTNWTQV